MSRRQRMTQLMENDAPKDGQDEKDAFNSCLWRFSLRQVHVENEEDQKKEGGVDVNANSRQAADSPRPPHAVAFLGPYFSGTEFLSPS